MADFEHENRQEEDRCLGVIRSMITDQRDKRRDIAAIIIEPVTAYQNQMATPYFYKRLIKMAKEEGIPFIIDETKSGVGITGKMWGHEHWNI